MSRLLGPLLALAGLGLAVWLLLAQDLAEVGALLRTAGFGLVLAALAHIPAMVLNAWAWAVLLPGARRPPLATMTAGVWVRESVNALLPVARVGGELAGYRLLRGAGVPVAPAAASLLADMALSVLSQLAFALLGLALLAGRGAGLGWGALAGGMAVGAGLGWAFVVAQRSGVFGRIAGALNALAAGKLAGLAAQSARVDRMTRRLWQRRRAVTVSFGWQLAAWLAGSLEIWLALHFLGYPVSVAEAVAIEAMIQAVSSAAFLVPGALGVQEAGFLGLGALLGLPPEAAAALALSRRLRDLLLYLPGLLAWVWAERRIARALPA